MVPRKRRFIIRNTDDMKQFDFAAWQFEGCIVAAGRSNQTPRVVSKTSSQPNPEGPSVLGSSSPQALDSPDVTYTHVCLVTVGGNFKTP
jgi:hypothetical protein